MQQHVLSRNKKGVELTHGAGKRYNVQLMDTTLKISNLALLLDRPAINNMAKISIFTVDIVHVSSADRQSAGGITGRILYKNLERGMTVPPWSPATKKVKKTLHCKPK